MKKWEDIVKDRLEGYVSPLPEGSLAEFRALRDGKAAQPAKKVAPWTWGVAAAVAAGLTAILFLSRLETPDDGIRVIDQPSTHVTAITDSSMVVEQQPSPQLIAQAIAPNANPHVSVRVREVVSTRKDEPEADIVADATDEENVAPGTNEDTAKKPAEETTIDEPSIEAAPIIPQGKDATTMRMKVAPAAGVVAGSGLLAAVVASGLRVGAMADFFPSEEAGYPFIGSDHPDLETTSPYADFRDETSGSPEHAFPLKLGLSARIPLADRLYLSTGLQYSLYSSSFTYRLTGEKKQIVHYIGVPVQIDWVFASGRLFDVYVGGGLQADACMGATLGGKTISKDGLNLSLLGAGGIQMNMTKHLGLYVEPELSLRIPSENHVLRTYRSEHPLMFSVAAGLRINMGKK